MVDYQFNLLNKPHIWILKIDSQKQHFDQFKKVLSEVEKIKANKYRFEKDRITSILSRGTLRILLSQYLQISPNSISFEYGKFGKPIFKNSQNLQFNVSHSENLIVFGFAKNIDIGIDVEYCKTNFDVMDIVDNYFSKKEISTMKAVPRAEQTEVFYRGWTRKEAFIKATAKGLSFPLNAFSVSIDKDDRSELEETLWNSNEKNEWSIIPFKTLPNYKAALAIRGMVSGIEVLEFSFNLLNNIK